MKKNKKTFDKDFEPLISEKEASEFLGMHIVRVRDIRCGREPYWKEKIPYYKYGGVAKYRISELKDWISRLKVQ